MHYGSTQCKRTTAGHQRAIYCLENVAENLLASGGDDGVKIWKWEHLLNPSQVQTWNLLLFHDSLSFYCAGGETSGYFSTACFVSSVCTLCVVFDCFMDLIGNWECLRPTALLTILRYWLHVFKNLFQKGDARMEGQCSVLLIMFLVVFVVVVLYLEFLYQNPQ